MRLLGLRVDNFRSFERFEWAGMDSRLNVIVGPNGAGKTNLFKAMRAAVDAVNPLYAMTPSGLSSSSASWRRSARIAPEERPIRIELDLTFDTQEEREALVSLIAASFCDQNTIRDVTNHTVSPEGYARFADLVLTQLRQTDLSWLFTGRLVVAYGNEERWVSRYEARPGGRPFRVSLDSPFSSAISVGELPLGAQVVAPFHAWWAARYEGNQAIVRSYLEGSDEDLPPSIVGDIDLETLLQQEPRRALRLSFRRQGGPALPAHRALERVAGRVLDPTGEFGARELFGHLIRRAFVFTENVRRAPRYEVLQGELTAPGVGLVTGEELALYLFQKQVSDAVGERREYGRIQALFKDLTGCSFHVSLPRQETVQSHVGVSNAPSQPPHLRLTVNDGSGEVPLEDSGAGRAEALFLSAAIVSVGGKVVLLDEPVQNLHPNMQTTLMDAIEERADSQFFVVTHSPSLIPPDAIEKVSRFYKRDGETSRASLSLDALSEQEKATVGKELRESTDARALLFARGVILVEGGTELGALPLWYREQHGRRLQNDDIALYSVDGETAFTHHVLLLEQFGIPWAVVCDGRVIGDPGLSDRKRCHIAGQLKKAGLAGVPNLDGRGVGDRCAQLHALGVFTLAKSARDGEESFEGSITVDQALWDEAKSAVGDSKPRQGRYVAEQSHCPPEVGALLDRVATHLGTRS